MCHIKRALLPALTSYNSATAIHLSVPAPTTVPTLNRTSFSAGVVVIVVFLFATCLNGFMTCPSLLELPSSSAALPENGQV